MPGRTTVDNAHDDRVNREEEENELLTPSDESDGELDIADIDAAITRLAREHRDLPTETAFDGSAEDEIAKRTQEEKMRRMSLFAKSFWLEHGTVLFVSLIVWLLLRQAASVFQWQPLPSVLEMIWEDPSNPHFDQLGGLFFGVSAFSYLLSPISNSMSVIPSRYSKVFANALHLPWHGLPAFQKLAMSIVSAALMVIVSVHRIPNPFTNMDYAG